MARVIKEDWGFFVFLSLIFLLLAFTAFCEVGWGWQERGCTKSYTNPHNVHPPYPYWLEGTKVYDRNMNYIGRLPPNSIVVPWDSPYIKKPAGDRRRLY